jgi:inorganic triphosphatase YgiF
METELKFALSPEARRIIEHHVALHRNATEATAAHTDRTIYFDTSDVALRRAGFSLRIRHRRGPAGDDGRYVQTIKAAGNGSGLRRQEWEWTIAGADLELERLDEVPGLSAALTGGHADLQPVFCTEVRRSAQVLHPANGVRVELALDDGVIVAGRQTEPLSELELELKEGPPEALLRLGLEFVQAAPLSLQIERRADHGYRLQDGHGSGAHKAAEVVVAPRASAAEGFARLAGSALEHLLANQPAALRGEQTEGVHQMRVAVRRLRSLLLLFAPLVEQNNRRRFTDELRRFGDCLGTARDWDAFVEETLPKAHVHGLDHGWMESLRQLAEEKRHAAHQAVKKAIAEPAFARFVLSFRAWSGCAEAALTPHVSTLSMKDVAGNLLGRLERKVARRLDRSDADDPASLHALRKSVKKLRYGIEYLDALFGPEAQRYVKRCNALQKKLGALNDLETASRCVVDLADNGRLDLAPAMGALVNWGEAKRPKLVKKALKARAAYSRQGRFW